jgi:SAM-dependent methyltransferase
VLWGETEEIGFPSEEVVHRKAWEYTMIAITLFDQVMGSCGKHDNLFLGLGAGREPLVYWLTNFGAVCATDLYLLDTPTAPLDMLRNPAQYAPGGMTWQPYQLRAEHMDMRDLRYPSDSFDGVFSASAIEHVGAGLSTPDDIAQAASEIGRVLKPGGVAAITTEYRLDGPGMVRPQEGLTIFDEDALMTYIVAPSGLELVDALDTAIDDETLATAIDLEDCIALGARGERAPEPHIVLRHNGYLFTSVHLALRKPEA